MDRIDKQIIQVLMDDGRISNVELAEQVGLSPSACLRRVQELERRQVILGYRARVNPEAMGRSFVAYTTVGLSDHSKRSQRQFEEAVRSAPEVVECHNTTGAFEFLLRIEVADLAAYKAFHTDVLGTVAEVRSLTTYVVMESAKDQRA